MIILLRSWIRDVDMSEWLRRQTRNLLGFARAGSNPAVDDLFFTIDPHDGQAEAINIGEEVLIDSTNGDNQATNDNRNTTHVDVNLDRLTDHIDIQPSEDSSFQPDILIQDIGILLLVLKLKF
ncbi:hypothetical protein EJB05_17453, partial [Eragrostis curvula]